MLGRLVEFALTYKCERQITIQDYRVALASWVSTSAAVAFVIWQAFHSLDFLAAAKPINAFVPYFTDGTWSTGENQFYVDTNGVTQQFNVHEPHYCKKGSPYTADYKWNANDTYDNISCMALPREESVHANSQEMFVTTFIQDRIIQQVQCSHSHPSCNSSSPSVQVVANSCRCEKVTNSYAINPEGLTAIMNYDWTVEQRTLGQQKPVFGGNLALANCTLLGGCEGPVGTVTFIQDHKGSHYKKVLAGYEVRLSVGEVLMLVGLSLDNLGSTATCLGSDEAHAGNREPQCNDVPYQRLAGNHIHMFMGVFNHGYCDSPDVNCDWLGMHEPIVLLSFRHNEASGWAYGETSSHYYNYKHLPFDSGDFHIDTEEFSKITRKRYGIKLVFNTYGEIGYRYIDYTSVMHSIVAAIVLVTTANSMVKYYATSALTHDGTSQCIEHYQNTRINLKQAITRSAAIAALEHCQFLQVFDVHHTGNISPMALFQNLRAIFRTTDHDLTDGQIARLVRDILQHGIEADSEEDCSMYLRTLEDCTDSSEIEIPDAAGFIRMVTDPDCRIKHIAKQYKGQPEDPEMLKLIENEGLKFHKTLDEDYDTELRSIRKAAGLPLHDHSHRHELSHITGRISTAGDIMSVASGHKLSDPWDHDKAWIDRQAIPSSVVSSSAPDECEQKSVVSTPGQVSVGLVFF